MSYREKPREKPLIWTLSQGVIAVDPESGAKLWDLQMESTPQRVFMFEEALFITSGGTVQVLDLHTGQEIETKELGFGVSAILIEEDHVFLAGGHGMACMGPGRRILWSVTTEREKGSGLFAGTESSLVCRDDQGAEVWRTEPGKYLANGGLMLGDAVVQPDLDRDT